MFTLGVHYFNQSEWKNAYEWLFESLNSSNQINRLVDLKGESESLVDQKSSLLIEKVPKTSILEYLSIAAYKVLRFFDIAFWNLCLIVYYICYQLCIWE